MTTVFVATPKHAKHIAIIDGNKYYRSYANGRTPTDRRAYYKQYRATKRQIARATTTTTTGADTGAGTGEHADTVDTSTDDVEHT